jgi:hypothetical protein
MRVSSLRSRGLHQLYDRLLFGEHVHTRPIGPGMWREGTSVRQLLEPDARVRQRILHVTEVSWSIDALTCR